MSNSMTSGVSAPRHSREPTTDARNREEYPSNGVGLALLGLAVGATAVGALAIDALAIGHLAIRRSRTDKLSIGELTVDKLLVTDQIPPPVTFSGK